MQPSSSQKRTFLVFLGILLGVALGGLQYWMLSKSAPSSPSLPVATAGPIGGPLLLQKTNGTYLKAKDFGQKPLLVFFGFTHCPSFCPAALSTITDALEKVSPAKRSKLDVYFVSVDPKRDSLQALQDYMENFASDIQALRGNEAEIKATLQTWKAYAAEVPQEGGNYTVDHSTFVYLVDPAFNLMHLFRAGDSAEDMAKILNAKL